MKICAEDSSTEPVFWRSLDAVILINLDHRKDRLLHARNSLKKISCPEDKIYRISASYGKDLEGFGKKPWFRKGRENNKWAGRAGCTLSHKTVMDLYSKMANILILKNFELKSKTEIWSQLETVLFESNTEWLVCYFHLNDNINKHTTKQVEGCKIPMPI